VITVLGLAFALVGQSLGKDLRSRFDTGASIVGMCDGFAIMSCQFWDVPAG
jgi:phosphoribosylformylglycinamidine (FGAM) synthase-like amidotransferase family enzyme